MLAHLSLLALAGALGALSRYGVYHVFIVDLHERFPWATLTVNLLGCFLFSFIAYLANEAQWVRSETAVILLAGFLGSFTTFSTFAFEGAKLLEYGYYGRAIFSILANNLGGLLCVMLGWYAARVVSS